MPEPPRPEDWELLGLRAGANRTEVEGAYRSRQEAYGPGSLAAYGLLAEEDCAALLERIRAAFERLDGSLSTGAETGEVELATTVPSAAPKPPPEPRVSPGAYLRFHRERQGQTLDVLAAQTRIRASLIRALEAEDFTALPEPVYVRGFVVSLARLLHLPDAEHLARHYLRLMQLPPAKP